MDKEVRRQIKLIHPEGPEKLRTITVFQWNIVVSGTDSGRPIDSLVIEQANVWPASHQSGWIDSPDNIAEAFMALMGWEVESDERFGEARYVKDNEKEVSEAVIAHDKGWPGEISH